MASAAWPKTWNVCFEPSMTWKVTQWDRVPSAVRRIPTLASSSVLRRPAFAEDCSAFCGRDMTTTRRRAGCGVVGESAIGDVVAKPGCAGIERIELGQDPPRRCARFRSTGAIRRAAISSEKYVGLFVIRQPIIHTVGFANDEETVGYFVNIPGGEFHYFAVDEKRANLDIADFSS